MTWQGCLVVDLNRPNPEALMGYELVRVSVHRAVSRESTG